MIWYKTHTHSPFIGIYNSIIAECFIALPFGVTAIQRELLFNIEYAYHSHNIIIYIDINITNIISIVSNTQ